MIIDIRCRYLTPEAARYFDGFTEVETHDSPESYVGWLGANGVQTALSPTAPSLGLKLGRWDLPPRSVDNDQQSELQRRFPQRFVGVAGIDPGNKVHDGMREFERCVDELGLRVATIEPGRRPLLSPNPADPRLYDFYAFAQEREVPVILQTSGFKGGANLDYAHPRWIDQVAHDFPDLHIICAHGCAPYLREMNWVLWRRPNVFASPDCYTYMDFKSCRRFPAQQLVFASAYPFMDLRDSIQLYVGGFWGRGRLDDILYRNAIRALKLESDPFFAGMLDGPRVFGLAARNRARLSLLFRRGLRRRRRKPLR